jgi:hypothetical protein
MLVAGRRTGPAFGGGAVQAVGEAGDEVGVQWHGIAHGWVF